MYGSFSVKVNLRGRGTGFGPKRAKPNSPRSLRVVAIRLPAAASDGPAVDPCLDTTVKTPKRSPAGAQTLMKIPRADIAHRIPYQKSTVARAKASEPFRGPAQDANPAS